METRTKKMFNLTNNKGTGPAKPYEAYAQSIHKYRTMREGWDKDIASFNAYKHCFTNYTKVITMIHQSDIEHEESKRLITQLYRELYSLIPAKLQNACKTMYSEAIKEYRELCM